MEHFIGRITGPVKKAGSQAPLFIMGVLGPQPVYFFPVPAGMDDPQPRQVQVKGQGFEPVQEFMPFFRVILNLSQGCAMLFSNFVWTVLKS